MVDRDPQSHIVVFNPEDQDRFSVPAELDARHAVATATVFNHVAVGLVERAITLDLTVPAGRQRAFELTRRATELGGIAARIFDLCPDEHLALLMEAEGLE